MRTVITVVRSSEVVWTSALLHQLERWTLSDWQNLEATSNQWLQEAVESTSKMERGGERQRLG